MELKQLQSKEEVVDYCKNNFLNSNTHTRSIQPKTIPLGIVTKIQMINLSKPPFFDHVDHLTTISVIQFTPGINNNKSCTIRLCLLNQVIFQISLQFLYFHYSTHFRQNQYPFCKFFDNFSTNFIVYITSIPFGAETDVFTLPSSCKVCSTDKIP